MRVSPRKGLLNQGRWRRTVCMTVGTNSLHHQGNIRTASPKSLRGFAFGAWLRILTNVTRLLSILRMIWRDTVPKTDLQGMGTGCGRFGEGREEEKHP